MGARLVLAGAGLAHLLVLERLARRGKPGGLDVTLIAPDPQHAYSGMVPGLVGGRYRPAELLIDLAALAGTAGAKLLRGAVRSLDLPGRAVVLDDGRRVAYELLSLAIGSEVAGPPDARTSSLPVKPIGRTLEIVPALERVARGCGAGGPRVVVAGGGAAGVELALNLRARLLLLGRADAPVTIVDGGDAVLRDRSRACRRIAERVLARRRVDVVLGSEVARADGEALALDDGRALQADLLVWATGPAAPSLFGASGLATDAEGYVRVDATLRSTSHPEVFASGDAAALAGSADPPKAGVFAVRQGAVLGENLLAAAAGRPVRRHYRPQRRFLALLNTGDGRAILSYGALATIGRWAMRLKDRIDRRFMKRLAR